MPAQVKAVIDKPTGLTKYVWRTDLMATQQYWKEWFRGLTKAYLECPLKKQLLLAASERMDKELTIAQMQGKFQMIIIEDCGHVIQEDQPAAVARAFRDLIHKLKVPEKYNEQMYVTSVSGKKILINR